MGISIQEFLAGREPCEVCDSTGNQHHCITELLSRQDSCILYNAKGLNQTEQILNDTADRKSTRLNSSHSDRSRMPSSA
jgi:hypothetical protein